MGCAFFLFFFFKKNVKLGRVEGLEVNMRGIKEGIGTAYNQNPQCGSMESGGI